MNRAEEHAGAHVEEVSLLDLANVLLCHRRLVIGLPMVLAAVVGLFTLFSSRTYTATTSFTPQTSEGQMSRLSGLAASFGVSVPTSEVSFGPEFYADLLKTRAILKSAVETVYALGPGGGSEAITGDLVALYEAGGRTRPERVERATDLLEEQIAVRTDLETGVVTCDVTTRWATLSGQLAARILELVNAFNLETRQSQASAERRFIEERLAEAKGELTAAEGRLKDFLEQNRRYENSPELRFEYERLQRQVSLQQQLYLTLSESYEEAKIDEVRNTPVITIIETPETPVRPDSRHFIRKVFLALFLGGVLGVGGAFVREFAYQARRAEGRDYREFTALSSELRDDLRLSWKRTRGLFRRQG